MNRKGFTLIELLIVVVIIGILAAIAIPKFANTKEKAYLASMKSDLRNMVTAEEAYFADSVKYIAPASLPNFAFTTGVSLNAGATTTDGWWASVKHSTSGKTCGIYVGSDAGTSGAAKEGEPKCS
jgi:prepilin-type N-terminal cleavage/methylation domain-containing protein